MALKPCRECGKAVSTNADKCPHCGTPHPTSQFSKGARGCLWVIGIIVGLGALSSLLSETEDTPSTAQQSPAAAPAPRPAPPPDTTFYFVKRLLNASPADVAAVLGQPDKALRTTTDCVYLERCTTGSYRNEAFDIEYSDGRAKTLTIQDSRLSAKPYAPNFLTLLNLAGAPAVNNAHNIRWSRVANGAIDEVVIFPAQPRGIRYALINVNKDHHDKLPIVGAEAIRSEGARSTAAATARQAAIDAQFSSWDGSHRGIVAAVKENMNDPGSFEHVSTQRWIEGDNMRIKMVFRGTNAFGAKVMQTAIAKVTVGGQITELSVE